MMRRFLSLLLLLFISLTVAAEIVPLTVLFQGDVHSYFEPGKDGRGGAARAAGYFKRMRKEIPNLLILNSGDMVTGTPVSLMFKGDPVFHVANHYGLDAAAIGNHEFDNGWRRIERYCDIARFPLLCSNAYYTGEDGQLHALGDASYLLIEKDGLRIAIVGVVTQHTPLITKKQDTIGLTFIPAVDALEASVKEIESQCDLIVALTHVGIENDPEIAERIPQIDLIVGGHSHTRLLEATFSHGIPIVHSGDKGRYIGRVDLTADTETDRIIDFKYMLIPVDESIGEEDAATAAEVKHWEDQVAELVDRPLGTAKHSLSKPDMIMLANAAFMESTGADYSYHNSGGTRGAIEGGEFSYRTIWNIFPFENTIVVAKVKGCDIPEGFFGLKKIDPSLTYRIATNSYVRDQIETIFPTLKDVEWEDSGVWLRDSVIRYIEQRKTIERVTLMR